MPRLAPLLILAALLAGPAPAQDRATVERSFQAWLEEAIWPRAEARGVSRGTFDEALGGVALDWILPDLAPPGAAPPEEEHQAEFASPGAYFAPGALEGTAAAGRDMMARHAETLAAVERATGVPARILVAIWGRESAYGRADLPHDAFTVLGTRGFMGRNAEGFAEELVAALEVAEAGDVAPRAMRSSWAGALGQPQFMPSSVLDHAADGDGDGRADLWGSEADTLASIGRYLAAHGWVPGRDWGFEVTVPASVSCTLEGPDQGRSIAAWEAMGIARVGGRPFPEGERAGEGFLVMPAGRHGPAFLATPNFYALKAYNESDLYALFVGHLGDRIAYGVGPFAAGWDETDRLLRSDVAGLQRALQAMGHDTGGADGLAGFRTRRSIGRWQEAEGRPATCFPDAGIVAALRP